MPLQNSTGVAISKRPESSPPPNPKPGDIWLQCAENDPKIIWETWYRNSDKWHSAFYYWNFSYTGSTAFNQWLICQPVVENWDLYIENWAVHSLMTSAVTSTNRWNFTLSAISSSNGATTIGTLTNLNAAANQWDRKGLWRPGYRSFSTDKLLRLSGTPGGTVQSVNFSSTICYQLARL
jgi:hypothetical protein